MLVSTAEWGIFLVSLTLIALVCAGMTFLILPAVIRKARKRGFLDRPNSRKIHSIPTPRLGGLGIAPALWLGGALSLIAGNSLVQAEWSQIYSSAVIGLILGCSAMFLLGLIDDLKQLRASQKLIVQIAAAIIAANFLPIPESLMDLPLSPLFGKALVIGWLVVIPNSVNLLDGVDGLTGSLVGLFFIVISFLACVTGQYGWLFLTVAGLASIAGFLYFNWSPARIFLGDAGSLTLGFIVAYLSLYFSLNRTPLSGFEWNPLLSILLTLVWVLDTSFAIARRYFGHLPPLKILRRRSKAKYLAFHGFAFKKIWAPDQGHIHHQLRRAGFHSSQIVAVISLFSFFGMLACIFVLASETTHLFTPASFNSWVGIFGIIGAAFFTFQCKVLLHNPVMRRVSSRRDKAQTQT